MSTDQSEFPTALPAPDSDVTPLTLTMAGDLLALSRESPRKRVIQRIHKSQDEGAHRMFNAMQPGTYIAPHRHLSQKKGETFIVVSGSLLFLEFTDDGELKEHTLLQPGTEAFGIDVAPHVYHSFIVLKPDTLIFEVKEGPLDEAGDKDVPTWAPHEGTEEAEPYLLALLKDLAAKAQADADNLEKLKGEAAGPE